MREELIESMEYEVDSKWKVYKLDKITEPIKETYNPDGSNDLIYIGLEHIEQETLKFNSVGVLF